MQKLLEQLTEEEIQKLQKEFEVDEEIGVVDPSFKPFIKNNSQNMFRAMSSNLAWPAPGSVKLNGKEATPTDHYAEWEIELSVEAKDIDSMKATDIVLLLDRSGSMRGNRLTKAKEAAIQFVNELLTEGSQTRVALVSFSNQAQTNSNFRGSSERQQLINAINNISASGGTNIQAGLRVANNLVAPTSAVEKIIVLLSDGEPTYSYRANNATAHSWQYGSYNFRLTNFTNNQIGSGDSYNLSDPICIPLVGCFGGDRYTVNGYTVRTNGPATISEAWEIMNVNEINMYSIGLDVGGNTNAINVLRNSQNKGYFQAGVDDLSGIFDEIAGEIKYAATNAVVTDPLGDMFKLVKGKYNGNDYEASTGTTVTWDESTKTFTWNIGDIREGEKPTLKYTVTIDWEHPDLKGHIDYPMNKETPLHYRDSNGNDATKYFKIPEGQIDKGKIKRIGYRVNVDGEPVDADGNPVGSIEEAHKFYDEYVGDLHDFGTHDVHAKEVPDYTLVVGDDPQEVTLSPDAPVKVVYFGYVKTTDMKAGEVTAIYVDEEDNEIAPSEVYSGTIGQDYTTEQKDIEGYEFVRVEGNPTGKFAVDPISVKYIYKKKLGSITIIKEDEDGERLAGATFELKDEAGNTFEITTDDSGMIVFEDLDWGEYVIKETKAPEGYTLIDKEFKFNITKENLHHEETITNSQIGWEIPKTGGIGTLGFYMTGILLTISAAWFVIRRRIVS